MQQVTEGLNRLRGGVLSTYSSVGSLFAKSNHDPNPQRNIEYLDEMSASRLGSDLHYSEIVGVSTDNRDTNDHDEDDFEIIETPEIAAPTCPHYYIPFSQTVEICDMLIRNWLRQIWFLPSDWKTGLKIHTGRSCMVPFFVFDAKTHSEIAADVLLDSESGQRKWEHISDYIQSEYHEIIVCASCSINQKLTDKLLYSEEHGFSFHTQQILPSQLHPYPPQNVSSINETVLPLDMTKQEAWALSGKHKIPEWEKQKGRTKIMSHKTHSVHGIQNMTVETEVVNFQHFVLYLPIYFSSFNYGDKTYEVLVSGNKGVVVGNNPIGTGSGGKFIMGKLKSLSNLVSDTIPM